MRSQKMEKLENSYQGLRLSDGGALYIIGYVALYIMQLLVIVIAKSINNDAFNESVWSQYMFSIVNQVALFCSPLIWGKIVNKPIISLSRIKTKLNLKQIALCIVIGTAGLMAFLPIANAVSQGFISIGYKSTSNTDVMIQSWWTLILSIIVVGALPAIGEEFLFRAGIARAFKIKNYVFAVVLSALLFGLVHGSAIQFIHQFLMGIVFAVVYFVTGSLISSIIVHFINNALTLALSYTQMHLYGASGFPISGGVLAGVYVAMFVVGFIILIVAIRALIRQSRIKAGKSVGKIDVAGFFKDFGACFYPKGIVANYRKANATMKELYNDPLDSKALEEDPENVSEDVDDNMRKMLIQSNLEMQARRRRLDRIAIAIAMLLALGVWVINLITALR